MAKISFDLVRLIEAFETERSDALAVGNSEADDETSGREIAVDVLFDGEINALIQAGYPLQSFLPQHAVAYLNVEKIRALANEPNVRSVRRQVRRSPILRTSLPNIRLDEVRTLNVPNEVRGPSLPPGAAPRGAGVTIGIIDDGVYVDVQALRSGGSTTIFRLWDQTFRFNSAGAPVSLDGVPLTGTANEPKNESGALVTHALARTPSRLGAQLDYGIEFNANQIDAAVAGSRPLPVSLSGTFARADAEHGTQVACIAAGHTAINSGSEGVAPNVRLIVVKSTFTNKEVTDAIAYIIAAADEASPGNPIVVNCSFGSHFGPHNGMGSLALLYDKVMADNPRVALVVGAANERNCNSHAAVKVSRGSAHRLWLYIWEDIPDLILSCSFNAGIKMSCRVSNVVHDSGVHDVSVGGEKTEGDHKVIVETAHRSPLDPDRHFFIEILPVGSRKNILTGLWTIEFEVDEQSIMPRAFIHVWRAAPFGDKFATEFIRSPASPEPTSPQDDARPEGIQALRDKLRQKRPENWIRCTLSSEASSRRAIVVAAYDAHTAPPALFSEAAIADFSSQGPDATNLMAGLYVDYPGKVVKPDIAAPGVSVGATSVWRDAQQTVQENIYVNDGTSFAAPHITGVLALMWAENPSLTNVEIKQRLLAAARGPLDTRLVDWAAHNPKASEELWGAGVVDAFESVRRALAP